MTGNGKVNILLVDDQPAKLLSYEAILVDLQENLIKAGSAKEALQHLLKTDVAVILVDACMPEMDGFELAEMIRRHPRCKRTSIILVSAIYLSDFDRLRGYDCGAVDYVPVPIVPEVLRAKVSVFADLYRKTDELQRLNAELEERVAQRTCELEASTALLRESEVRYRAFVATSTDGICRLEFDEPVDTTLPVEAQIELFYRYGRLAECNDALAQMFGRTRAEELIGAGLADLLPPSDPACVRFLQTLIESGYRLVEAELAQTPRDGEPHWMSNNLVGVVEDGRLLRVWGTQRDFTERKRAEKERGRLLDNEREARAAAEQANRLKDEFLASLSHELRTPINAVLGWTQLMRRTQFDCETIEQGLDVIERGVRSQTQLIDDLLDVSRIISGKLAIEESEVDLASVVGAAVDALRPAAKTKGLVVETSLQTAAGAAVRGNAARLQQVFSNLLSNAIKFTPAGGRVEVGLERAGEDVRVTVSDTGQGIRPDFLAYVFERFRQADGSTTRRHGGLGLGLSIAKHLVTRHRGSICAESDGEGRGARFIVTLPPASSSASTSGPASTGGSPAVEADLARAIGGLKVMIVDDDPDTREVVARMLEDYGARTLTADGAYEALRALRHFRPDALICDIGMPGKDGYELIREVRAMAGLETVPAVALTAYTRAEDRARALEAGYHVHVAKPINPQELLAAVAALTRREPAEMADSVGAAPCDDSSMVMAVQGRANGG